MTAATALLALVAALGPLAARAAEAAPDPAAPGAPAGGGAAGGEPSAPQPAPAPEAPAEPVATAAAAHAGAGSWYALPVLFWLPETRLGFGATGGLHLDLGGPRPSSLFAAAVYTLHRQSSVDLAWDVYARTGALLSGRVRAVHWPDAFYGIGPDTRTSARETFTRREVEGVASVELPVPGVRGLRAGPRIDARAEEIADRAPGGQLDARAISGWNGYSAVAFGASVTWDTRDGAFWPSRGTLAQGWWVQAPAALGSNRGFGRGVAELRHFVPLRHGAVLGLHAYAEAVAGDPPFTLLPKLGSTRFLRGILEGRYRDRGDWATQAELRVPVRGRFSAVAFGAVGDVAPSLRALSLRTVKVAGGAGLRIRLTDAGANIRIDGAVSRFGPELYVLVLEAF